MLYGFIEESDYLNLASRPAEAMEFNGQYLEDLIPGYKTIHVTGRETLPLSISTSGKLTARDGELIESVVISPREITVVYSLSAESNEAFRLAFDTMKHHLMQSREPVPIRYEDDLAYTFFGQVSDIPEVEPGVNTVVGELRIYCADPYKYAAEASSSGTGSVAFAPLGLTEPVRPKIRLTLNATAAKITVTNVNTGKKIILNDTYVATNVIEINPSAGTITKNGGNIKSHLDYVESDFFHFLIRPGDQVVVTPTTTSIQLIYQRRLL